MIVCLAGETGEFGVDLVAFGFQFSERAQVPFPHGLDGRGVGVQVAECLDFADVGVLGGVDLLEPFAQPVCLFLAAGGVLSGAGRELFTQQGGPVGAEDAGGEELAGVLDEQVFPHADRGRVAGGLGGVGGVAGVVRAQVVGVVHVRLPGVVPGGGAGDAVHAALAGPAPHPAPQQVGAAGLRVGVQGRVVAAGAVRLGHLLRGVPGGPADDGRVGVVRGPDPLLGGHAAAAFAAVGAAAAEHHPPGVLRVGQDRVHPGGGPAFARVGRWVGVRVGIEPVGDLGDAESVHRAPGEDPRHHGRAGRVQGQAGLGAALGGFHRHGMRGPLRLVPVGGCADVPPVQGMLTQPFPGFLLDLKPIPFRYALLDPPDQDRGGVHARQVNGLIGGQQRDAGVVQLAFQFQRVERVPPGPFDVLTDHRRKPGIRAAGLGQQVGNPAIPGNAHVKLLVRAAVAACFQVQAAGFDVPEPGRDERPGRGLLLRGPGLPAYGGHRVLHHGGGGAAEERQR